jgi:cytochrome c553
MVNGSAAVNNGARAATMLLSISWPHRSMRDRQARPSPRLGIDDMLPLSARRASPAKTVAAVSAMTVQAQPEDRGVDERSEIHHSMRVACATRVYPGRIPLSASLHRSLLIGVLVAASAASGAQEVTGEAIYEYCTSCHGKQGAGGEDGKYPRIAGLPQAYVDRQLHAFKSQQRVNKPMIPIFKHHRFDDQVIATVSAHIASMSPPGLSLWPYEASAEARAAFPSGAAFAEAGAAKYAEHCSGCHGAAGEGDAEGGAPPLIDQYPTYLRKQIADFAAGRRTHAESQRCASVTPAEAEAVIGHLVEAGR